MTRIGGYCFNLRVLAWVLLGATAVLLAAPPVIQAAILLVVGTCPVTAIAGLCKAARFHVCLEQGEAWRPRPAEAEATGLGSSPYAGLVTGMFGRRK